jgi:hypothetical protein
VKTEGATKKGQNQTHRLKKKQSKKQNKKQTTTK